MKLTADRLKRVSITDLRHLEQNISMWFHLRDRQRNVAAAALGLGKAQKTDYNLPRATKMASISERHSRAVLNCSSPKRSLSNALQSLGPRSKPTARANINFTSLELGKILQQRLESAKNKPIPSPAKNRPSAARRLNLSNQEQPVVNTTINKQHHETENQPQPSETPVVPNMSALPPVPSRQEPLTPITNVMRHTDVNDNALSIKLQVRSPMRPRRFAKSYSLRKIVTLREHRKKCEQRVLELEAQAARLRKKNISNIQKMV